MNAFRTVVIASHREEARRQVLCAQLDGLGAVYSFFDAFLAPSSGDEARAAGYLDNRARELLGRPMTGPEIGCFMSHREVWRQAADAPVPTLVLESDAAVDRSSLEVAAELADRPEDWEMVMLNYHKCIPSLWQQKRLRNRRRLVKFANRRVYCLSTYMLTPAGAAKLARQAGEFFLPADDYACGGWVEKDVDLFAVHPRVATLHSLASASTIQASREEVRNRNARKESASDVLRRLELVVRRGTKALRYPRKGL